MYCTEAEPVGIDWSELDEKKRKHRQEIVRKSMRRLRAKARKRMRCRRMSSI